MLQPPNTNYIQLTISNRVAYIILNNPPLNILTIKMMKEINDVLDLISKKTPNEVCAVVFAAAPGSKMFSAGVSVEEHKDEFVYQMLQEFHGIYRNLNSINKPVIGVINGQALGGGCEFVAYCDLVIASPHAKFAQPEIKLGVFPPMASILLPKLIGVRRTTHMVLTGEIIDAQEAQNIGLINYVVPEDQLISKAEEILNILRGYSSSVLEITRQALQISAFYKVEEIMDEVEDLYLNQLMSLEDPKEGLDAFLQKRKPEWKHK